ncbi:MAG TPA: hypothetical protein VFJ51_08295 [Nitrososphaeraceae archaeon]|nr:hypothetical protein [Nitrososphaeraceae archaeon]
MYRPRNGEQIPTNTTAQNELLPYYSIKIGACYEKSDMPTDKESNDDNQRDRFL